MTQRMYRQLCLCLLCLLPGAPALAYEAEFPVSEGSLILSAFPFDDGSVLDLRQAYRTLGEPRRGPDGQVNNAVLIMHGTTGRGAGFLSERFAGVLFGPGQLLDASLYFIILPDAIGHGDSSKPSDGLRDAFPAYNYDDMVRAQYRLLTEHLGVDHLRLVTGTSMGGMMSWVWGYKYPQFMDALMPLASLPVEIAGRNRMLRKMIIDTVRRDPQWLDGNYQQQPPGLRTALYGLMFMVSSPLQYQLAAPTRGAAENYLNQLLDRYASVMDANDLIYAFDASRFYNPAPHLERIEAPLLAINSADDQVNPPELGILAREISRLPNGRAVVLPISSMTRGHGTHSMPTIWGPYLADFLRQTAAEPPTGSGSQPGPALMDPQDPHWAKHAPDSFEVRFRTTEGPFTLQVERALAPLGADRFYQLLTQGFYTGVRFHRVRAGYITQFGINGNPEVTQHWKDERIADDPVRSSNLRGSIAFAMTGPDTRTTQIYINLADNAHLDAQGFAPFAHISSGMAVVERLYRLYGESSGGGMRGGKQGPVETGGNDYLRDHYPLLDYILEAEVISAGRAN
ncbi:MAG: homoserine O-acetyltransferase [Halieaceae bacterium]|jgi:homoserine O-acetyltransferase